MGLFGGYEGKIDAKGRLVIRASFREELGSCVVATTIDNTCISLYSERNWEEVVLRLNELSRQSLNGARIQRRILANSFKQEVDSMGRMLIPETLRFSANIVQDVHVNGNNQKAEIWDLAHWKQFMNDTEELVPDINALIPGL
jgi:MraZ protein